MQLKQIPRDSLLKPLQAVSGIVERRHTLPILANVLLEQKDNRLYVTATDLEMQITAFGELAGKQDQSITVAARKLQDLLRALPEDATINIETSSSKMTVRASRNEPGRPWAISSPNFEKFCRCDKPGRVARRSAPPLPLRGLVPDAFAWIDRDSGQACVSGTRREIQFDVQLFGDRIRRAPL